MFEIVATLLEKNVIWINGFILTGVILILIGVRDITSRDLSEYKRSHTNIHKIDIYVAWGVFYIISGLLIITGGIASIYPYLK